MTPDFLTIYNEELRFLREAGAAFALQHPQVAAQLGFHRDGVQDPFVERLLEGSAFLTSRVHERLNHEQAGFAQNMLTHLAPGWLTPVPSITMIALLPDLSHPQWGARNVLPKGSRIFLKDASLGDQPATFITGHDVHIQPVEVSYASMLRQPPQTLPEALRRQFHDTQSCLHLTLSTRGIVPLNELEFAPLRLTLGQELVVMNSLLALLLTHTLRIVIYARQNGQIISDVLTPNHLRLAGLHDEALLPEWTGELPGSRLLREYFAAPGRFSTLLLDGLTNVLQQSHQCHECDVFFLFDQPAAPLFNQLHAQDFHLFAAAAINLYQRTCSPVNINHQHTEYPLVVDKLNASLYSIHHLTKVQGVLDDGEKITLFALTGQTNHQTCGVPQAHWSLRRQQGPQQASVVNPQLPAEKNYLSFSNGCSELAPGDVRALLVEALVCERHLRPERLQQPELSLERSLPVRTLSLIRHPSASVAAPPMETSWSALQILNINPLHYCLPEVKNCAEIIQHWLRLFVSTHNSSQHKQINSLRHATFSHHFERWRGEGPLCWVRATRFSLDLARQDHADQGALLFGWILWHALARYAELNQNLSFELRLDGELLTQREAINA